MPDSRLLVVGASREVTPQLAELNPLVLRLAPLTGPDVAAYLAAVGDVHPSWPPYVRERSGGNPLFVRELARLLVQEDRLASPATALAVPAELRRMAGYRLDRLSEPCRRLLGGASALGEEFDVAVLAAAASPDLNGVPELLTEAVSAGVLVDEPAAPSRLRFAHSLVRQARYDEMSRAERVEWHRRIAASLDAASLGHAQASEVARHRVRAAADSAGRRAAVVACRTAAVAAAGTLDFADAAHWYRRAVELLDGASHGDEDRAALMLDLAEATYADGQVTEALSHCAAVLELAERLRQPTLAARAALVVRGIDGPPNLAIAELCVRARALLGGEDSAVHAQVLAQHALAMVESTGVYTGTDTAVLDSADALSRQAMEMAERSGDPTALADALHAREKLVTGPDGVAERLQLGTRLHALAPVPNRPEAALWAFIWRIEAAFQLGAIHDLDTEIAGLAALVERLGWPLARWHLLRTQSARALVAGRFDEAAERAYSALAVAVRTQDAAASSVTYALIHEAQRLTGRFVPPEAELVRILETTSVPIALSSVGRYLISAGETDRAAALFERLRPTLATLPHDGRWLPTITGGGELAIAFDAKDIVELCYRSLLPYGAYYLGSANGYYGAVAGILGMLATSLGNYDTADQHLAEAEMMENRVAAPAHLAIARLAHARALVARGAPADRRRAAALAEQCAHAARRLGMAPALTEAVALADELTGVRASAIDVLTPREREIAGLVADGLANKAIAEKLVLSERTVETHVRNLLTKLGLTNRTQVAAWALRAGIRTGSA